MRKNIVLFSYLSLICLGLGLSMNPYLSYSLSAKDYGIVGVVSLLELFYIVPIIILLAYLARKWRTPSVALWLAFVGGLFLSSFFAIVGDESIFAWLKSTFPSHSFFNIFKDSLVAPFIEEPVKLLAVVWAIYFMPVKNLKSILLLGYAAGTGFEIREQFTFIAKNLDKGLAYSISQALGRIFAALTSHGLYTALTAFGLILMLLYYKKNQSVFYKGIFCFILPFVLHFLWNLPNGQLSFSPLMIAFEVSFSLVVLYEAFQFAKKFDRKQDLNIGSNHFLDFRMGVKE